MRRVTSLVLLLGLALAGVPGTVAVAAPPGDDGGVAAGDVMASATPRAPSMPAYPYSTGPIAVDASRVPGAGASIGPRVVHPGGRITATFGSASSNVRWTVTDLPGRGAGPCAASTPSGRGVVTCTFTLGDAGAYPRMPQWLTFTVQFVDESTCFSNGCFASTMFRAFVALTPAGSAVLSGSVRDRDNRMVPGVPVSIAGVGRRYVTATGGAGEFAALLPVGTWTVTPTGTWDPPSRVVALGTGGSRADFKAPVRELDFAIAGSRVVNGLDWTTAEATGLARRSGVVVAHTASGTPLANAVVQLDAPYRDGEAPGGADRPRIVVCDATWRSLVTTTDRAERVTDSSGQVPFTLLLGNEAGTTLWHARLRDDVTALDVERIGLSESGTGPSAADIAELLQKGQSLGLGVPPVSAISQQALQVGLVEWWLSVKASPWGAPTSGKAVGDFVPVRTADGRFAGLVFYPTGDPGPLRAHLLAGAPLPAGYPTAVLQFQQVLLDILTGRVNGWAVRLDQLPELAAWEATHGSAVPGYLGVGPGVGNGWLGGPIPPPATDRAARADYDRCVPGASPRSAVVEVHSPVRVTLPAGSGTALLRRSAFTGSVYLVPAGATLRLTGTGAGTARIVVRRGASASTFTITAARGVVGTLGVGTSGVPTRMTWARGTVRAVAGVPLTVAGLPRRLTVARTARLTLRVHDLFGAALPGALVSVRGGGLSLLRIVPSTGTVRLSLRPTRRGIVRVTVTSPGALGRTVTVAAV